MTIQVELSPEDESRLTREAVAHGVRPEKYAGDLLQAALAHGVRPKEYDDSPALDSVLPPEAKSKALTVERFHAMLHSLAEGAENLPNLTTESFTRESFYEDRNIPSDA
jgi:hypothetical protein